MAGFFNSAASYDTPEKKVTFFRRLLYHHSLYFYIKYAIIVFRTRRMARRKVYDTRKWYETSFFIFRFIEMAGGKFHISGMENIWKVHGPVVFIGNHMSTLETMILPSIIAPHRDVTFVVKESLVRHPLFRDVMKSRDPIVVGRSDPRKDFETVMTEGPGILASGTSIIIFPQSTRSPVFHPEDFNSLGVKLARKAGVPVVPIALKTDFWGNGKIIKEMGPLDSNKHIHFKFGDPFIVEGNGKEENNRIIEFIRSSLENWK